ncbi:MAG: phospho-N-acetylmuramoyl-pentapeptide-transferase [Pseudomonadota bacterium]
MLYEFLFPWSEWFQPFNLLRYITFRTGAATLSALILSFVIAPGLIRWLRLKQDGASTIREDTPEHHLQKSGTPTMGGFLIVGSTLASTLLWMRLNNGFVWVTLLAMAGFGAIGLLDDWLKINRKNSKGLSGRMKLLLQIICASVCAIILANLLPSERSGLAIPLVKDYLMPLGMLAMPIMVLVIVGTSNAVNLTDGLDGLAIVPVIIAAICFGLIAYLVGHSGYADYLQLHYVPGTGELSVMLGALIGAGLGFLWYNAPPAAVFMGDTGSLAIGGTIGSVAVATKHELVLVIIGGLFVLEAVSVMVQVVSFKLTGRRIFAMAPLHHHFEKKGWAEPTIVVRFWIISAILALIGLATLKIR